MANATNNLVTKTQKADLAAFLDKASTQESLMRALRDKKEVMKFTSSLISAVTTNPSLNDCTFPSLVSCNLVAHSLSLSLSPQLGFCYAVPFKQKEKRDKQGNVIEKECTKAQFVLSYRGYLQLAIRSGQYSDIDVIEIREGEYLGKNSMTGKPSFRFITDDAKRENLPVVGYMAYFEHINGFKKVIYWSKEKMLKHADRYSPAFSYLGNDKVVSYADYEKGNYNKKDEWKYSSFWYKDFEGMAFKTMIRQLISKWGLMSIELQSAFEKDESLGNDNFEDMNNLSTVVVKEDYAEDFEVIPPQNIDAETGEILADNSNSEQNEEDEFVNGFFG